MATIGRDTMATVACRKVVFCLRRGPLPVHTECAAISQVKYYNYIPSLLIMKCLRGINVMAGANHVTVY